MKRIALLLMFIAWPAFGQTPKAKFKAVAPVKVVPGEHIVVDATTATGDVYFFYDEVAFPKGRATLAGKVLVLSTATAGTYTINVASLDDKAKERIVVTVGDVPDPKPDPKPTDPIEKLRSEVTAGFAKLDARITALEGPRPPPEPKPGPEVQLNELGKLVLVQALKVGRKTEAIELAGSYSETVSAIRAGGVSSPAAAVDMLFNRNKGILKTNAQQWAGFFAWADNELTRRNEKGLLTTMAQHADAFEQFGAALRKAGE